MFRDEQAERKEYEERRRRGCDEVDPWFGHTSTDVTYAMQTPVPKHACQPRLQECAPDPSYNRTASDITAKLHSRPNSPHRDYYYGRQDTDITAHLQVQVPKFVNPHGCPSNYRAGQSFCQEEVQSSEEAHSHNQRVFDYMHPLGSHRPYPLSDCYYHSGSKPSTPCGSRSQSPSRRRSRSPGEGSRRRSRTPSPGRNETKCRPRPRSRSPSPRKDGMTNGPRSRSPGLSRDGVRCRSQTPSPRIYASYGHLPPGHNIPSKYLRCRNRCHLSPPCEECARLLDEDRSRPENCAPSAGKHCGCDDYDRRNASGIVCPFHGNGPCPLQAGYPCYGKRPWSPTNSPGA